VSSVDLLRRGIEAAHANRKVEAREIFMQVVEVDPRNELAWMWLSGLVDNLEDQIIACENVLTINPENQKVRLFLDNLKRKQQALRGENREAPQTTVISQLYIRLRRNGCGFAHTRSHAY
jgi:hypothetical protein